jgi:hypothetical protein
MKGKSGSSTEQSFRNRSRLLIAAALVAGGLMTAVSQALGSFDAPVNFAVGAAPEFVAVGDLNGDGDVDLVTANTTASNVSILLGDGAGSFSEAPESPIPVGAQPRSVAIGNLDAGGVPDLAVANSTSNDVSVLLGDGDGTFAAASPISAGVTDPRAVAIGSFNPGTDSFADLAITNLASLNVSVLLGTGAGSFIAAPGSPIAVPSSPFGIETGNFNGGAADLVVGSQSTSIYVLLGNGDGTFAAAQGSPIAVGAEPSTPGPEAVPQSVAVGNLDGDAFADIATANRGDNSVSVLLGNGDGTFDPKTQFDVGTRPQSVAIGQLNGGTIPDLAVANLGPDTFGPDPVSVLIGNGDGSFGAATDFPAGTDPFSVAIGGVNEDSLHDIVTANSGGANVSALLGTSAPTANAVPGRLDFDLREQGSTSAAQTVTVTNTSDDDQVEVSAVAIVGQDSGDFEISDTTCSPTPLAVAGTCEVDVTFTPSAAGQRFAGLEVAFNGAASPLTAQLAGEGAEPPVCPELTIGTAPDCVVLRARISRLTVTGPSTLRKGKAANYRAKITNSGNAPATRVRLVASGRGIRLNSPVGTVSPGATRTVKLRIRPSRTGRVKATFKAVSGNAGSKTVRRSVRVR